MSILIGTSGWSYPHWKRRFYPEDVPQRKWLEHFSKTFGTVEINSSFYGLPSRETFETWRRLVPGDFIFSVKASRYITHVKKLRDTTEAWQRLYENALGLAEKLGPVLFQFPPTWEKNRDRLAEFLTQLPASAKCAFEFRHPSWFHQDIYRLLRAKPAALCLADSPRYPLVVEVTAPFTFVRFHGSKIGSGSAYTKTELLSWAARITEFAKRGLDVYAYFNNDAFAYAVQNAVTLRELLKTNNRHADQ